MSTAASVPPLYPGLRLTREEFLRRWDHLPDLKNAELIDGIVHMPSPVSMAHGLADTLMISWLFNYRRATRGCQVVNNATWLMRNDVLQPDVSMRILPAYGGQSRDEGKYPAGAPELIVEVCQSSAAYDLGPKLTLYQSAGVQEYVAVLLLEKQVAWRALVDGQYALLPPDRDGILKSRVFPGLWLNPAAALADDVDQVDAVLQQGLQSQEHAAFVRRLESQRR